MESFYNDHHHHHHHHHVHHVHQQHPPPVVTTETDPEADRDGAADPEADRAGGPGGSGTGGTGVRALTACALFVLIVSTLLGNVLVCAAVIKFRHLRSKVTNSFVISLAVSDLFVAVLVMPWKAVSEVAGCWTFGRFCDTWIAFDIMCSTASILHLCIISMDRYWAISSPFRYERKMTQRFALAMIGLAWTLSILISFIPVQLNWHKAAGDVGGDAEDCNASLNRTYAISSSLISFYIPVVIMVGTYTRIFRIAQTQIRRISSLERASAAAAGGGGGGRHHVHAHAQKSHHLKLTSFRKETKVLKTLSIIMGVFVCCWLPFFVLNCVVPFCDADARPAGGPLCVSDTTFNTFVWFGWANSSLNPVIYAFNADFRRAFATILGCSRYCASGSSAVEAVDFSNELASYHHDTTLQKEAVLVLPGGGGGAEDQEVSVNSDASRDLGRAAGKAAAAASVLRFECEAEISLHLMPFSPSSGHPDCCYAIPGQVED
ncbi:unnamed protein product [Merluccius merluccius]